MFCIGFVYPRYNCVWVFCHFFFAELVKSQGPDSLISQMGATIMGGTETTFYVLAVYFGSVGVRRTRHAVPAGLCADLAGVTAAVIICNLVFGR